MREGGPSGWDGSKQAPTQEVFRTEAEGPAEHGYTHNNMSLSTCLSVEDLNLNPKIFQDFCSLYTVVTHVIYGK